MSSPPSLSFDSLMVISSEHLFGESETKSVKYLFNCNLIQIKHLTGTKILRILRAKGLASKIPEDLYHLIKKAVAIRKHLEKNRQDKDSKYRLILIESRVHKLARYYKTKTVLPPNWKYESATASALVA